MTSIKSNQSTTLSKDNYPHKYGTRDKSAPWYQPTLENIPEAHRDLLEKYSHIPPSQVIPRILEIRDRAWEIHPFPCIGQCRFMDLGLSRTPSYPLILSRLRNGASLLDLGCCFGQDLRKLVHDGVPSTSLYGAELRPEFISLGYELFLDKDTFGVHIMQANLFDSEGPLKELRGRMDIVQIGLFLHLFDLEGQIKACERVVELLKGEKGGLVTGQQVGAVETKQLLASSGSVTFAHNVESFGEMWREVGFRTGSKWVVRATLVRYENRPWDDGNTKLLVFEVERES